MYEDIRVSQVQAMKAVQIFDQGELIKWVLSVR